MTGLGSDLIDIRHRSVIEHSEPLLDRIFTDLERRTDKRENRAASYARRFGPGSLRKGARHRLPDVCSGATWV